MEKRADIGIRGQDFFGHCPQCGTSCEDEITSLANKFCEGFVAEAGDESNIIWHELKEKPLVYPPVPECGETVLDTDGNPVNRGGGPAFGKVYNVFNIQNRFDIFPVCGEMEVQDSGNYYYEFERAGIWNQSLDSTNELFFLLLKSVCLDTSISERSQHPHIVGTNSRSSGNFGINRGENRSRQFDNHEEVKKIGLHREISVANLGTITEVFTCGECTQYRECINVNKRYRIDVGNTYDTLGEAVDALKSLKAIPFFGGAATCRGWVKLLINI